MSAPTHTTQERQSSGTDFNLPLAAALLTDAAARAGAAIMRLYHEGAKVRLKDDASPVTEADKASEAIVIDALQRLAPDIPIVSEEMVGDRSADLGPRFFLVDPPGFYNVPFSCGDPAAVRLDLEAAGWREVEHETLDRTRPIPDPAAFAKAAVHGNPLITEIRQRGGVDPDEVERAVLAGLLDRFGASPTTMPLQATFFTCRVA